MNEPLWKPKKKTFLNSLELRDSYVTTRMSDKNASENFFTFFRNKIGIFIVYLKNFFIPLWMTHISLNICSSLIHKTASHSVDSLKFLTNLIWLAREIKYFNGKIHYVFVGQKFYFFFSWPFKIFLYLFSYYFHKVRRKTNVEDWYRKIKIYFSCQF